MKTRTNTVEIDPDLSSVSGGSGRKSAWPVIVGIGCWLLMAMGCLALKELMRQRPQFAGLPLRHSRMDLLQESPKVVLRKVRDDVSVLREVQADRTDVSFRMKARRDYRGLRTIIDMAGDFHARYTLANPHDEPVFVLFRCQHPRPAQNQREGLNASALTLDADGAGMAQNTASAWFWSGEIGPGDSREISVSYQVSRVGSVQYHITSDDGLPIKAHRVEIVVDDLPAMVYESSDGRAEPENNTVVWERNDFLPPEHFSARIAETRSLYTALDQLLDIGPLVSLLFMVAAMAVMLSRGRPTALQVITIAAGYSFYFPLILYLSAKFSFPVALMIAFAAPGILLLNYTRVLLGLRIGLFGGGAFLILYQVFPTLGAFAGWNRGMALLCLGMVTLFVLIDLQNRAMRRAGTALLVFLLLTGSTFADNRDVQVVVPGTLVGPDALEDEPLPALVSFGVAEYQATLKDLYVDVQVSLPLEVVRAGDDLFSIFEQPVHILSREMPAVVRLITGADWYGLQIIEPGQGIARFGYRAAISISGKRLVSHIPLLRVPAGKLTLVDLRPDIEFSGGDLWSRAKQGDEIRYEVGVAGAGRLTIEAPTVPGAGIQRDSQSLARLYGIRITESQHLTVINSDGTCTHFAEYQLPPFHPGAFDLDLPEGSRIISVSVDASEVAEPDIQAGRCTIRLDEEGASSGARRVSLRLALPSARLGFIGFAELALPDPGATIGALGWTIVLPSGFETQVVSSGLDDLGRPADLKSFGDYGRVLQKRERISLAKTLVPPGIIKARLKYSQQVKGITASGSLSVHQRQ